MTPLCPLLTACAAVLALSASAQAASAVQVGATGKTFASAAAECALDPATGLMSPQVQAGLYQPKRRATANVLVNGVSVQGVDAATPAATVWLPVGASTVTVALSRRVQDSYQFTVSADQCALPPVPGNYYSADGSLEYAASGKSYLTVAPGCALNPASGMPQPFVNLFDNGGFLLNVSVNGQPLTQLSALRPRVAVFLSAGVNTITAANGTVSTDRFLRDGGSGTCVLP